MNPAVTILMPCLNEERTIEACVAMAAAALQKLAIPGEVLIADNGSTDRSIALAEAAGARVIRVTERGYGAALRAGIADARGEYVIFGDSDLSYDFSAAGLRPYIEALKAGADLVMGNRFKGGIKPGAMPALHRYFGTPFMTIMVNIMFGTRIGDINCGLRGIRKTAYERLACRYNGMEFASEIFIRAAMAKLNIAEVPTTLSPDGRNRPPHLRSFRDGFRHMRVWFALRCGYSKKS